MFSCVIYPIYNTFIQNIVFVFIKINKVCNKITYVYKNYIKITF